MIRREIQLPGQPTQWLLVSQIEHARISGLLAEHCLSHLDASLQTELLQAIIHHDDGWADWEVAPQLDIEHDRPLSFRELQLEDSLTIWTASIEVAKEIGPRAAWVVASHFLVLFESSKESKSSFVTIWHKQMVDQCRQWRNAWRSLGEARESLRWLQLFDVLSLWLCSVCPTVGEQVVKPVRSYHVGGGSPFESKFFYLQEHARMDPWRLNVAELEIAATGWLVPIQEYRSSDELLAARVAHSVQWKLAVG